MMPDTEERRFIIGIDLGTTNCAAAYVDLQEKGPGRRKIRVFKIPQLTGPGQVKRLPLLPSFLYIPGEYDIPADALVRLWPDRDTHFVGTYARDHGALVPDRLVSSAKSWLCHARVDRRARILPWGAAAEIYKISPVAATAAYLKHIRLAWNSVWGADDSLLLENQFVIITVPASFDEVARELTLEAARAAGMGAVLLLEEPLAAFYNWLMHHENNWRAHVQPGETVLVCDVGGGTTDFTLIALRDSAGSPRFERIAVGDHLILGGDNIDLALARRVEAQLSGPQHSMSTERWKALCHQCRQAKEALLGGAAQNVTVTLMGEGSRLIAGTQHVELDRGLVTEVVLKGFFPSDAVDEGAPPAAARKGISEFGLPYEPEPAITRHMLAFLNRHHPAVAKIQGQPADAPDLILYNGGSLKPPEIQAQIRQALQNRASRPDPQHPRVLESPDLDLAVAFGAAYYGLVKIGEGVRVGSGSPRGYYLGVARAEGSGPPPAAREVICIVERGLDEGSPIDLKNRDFEVLTNQPVSFDVFSSSYRSGDRSGDLLPVDDSFTPLPPLQTVVQYGKKGVQKAIPVTIEAAYTEVGTLALWCRSRISEHRWKLQFHLRESPAPAAADDARILELAVVEAARSHLEQVLAGDDKSQMQKLAKDLSRIVELPRDDWPLGFIRGLADDLLDRAPARGKGPDVESGWTNLLGFCLRPGIGEGLDKQRLQRLWKLYQAGPVHAKNPRVRLEWWIMWRRVAAGLTPGQQRQVFQDLSPVFFDKKSASVKVTPQERLEIWMAAANLEKLHGKDKIRLGRQLLSEITPRKLKAQHLWALSRLAARDLLYGPADRVIPPEEAAHWIGQLIGWPAANPTMIGRTVSQIARQTGDRARDLDEEMRQRVLAWMAENGLAEELQRRVSETTPPARDDQVAMFGESLPLGIILKTVIP
ncbi:MAG: Hsp70 family protein [Desulfobacterales bacterium]